jgi:hypothetical protein
MVIAAVLNTEFCNLIYGGCSNGVAPMRIKAGGESMPHSMDDQDHGGAQAVTRFYQ